MRSRRHEQTLVLAAAGAVLVAAAFLPLANLAAEALGSYSEAAALLGSSRPWALLARSLLLASAVTVLALVVGTPLGVIVGRTDAAGARVAGALHVFPMFLPPFLLGLGWFHLLGRQGLVGSEASARALFSEVGVVFVLSLAFAPVVTSLTALGVRGVDPSLEEAARTVARPVRVAARILLPAAWPAIALAAIVVFALALSELGVPMFLRVDVFAAAVFARLGGIDYAPGEAVALLVPLLPVALGLLWVERRLVGTRSFAVLGLRAAARSPLRLGRWRAAATGAVWLAAAVSVAPIAALALSAWRGGGFSDLGEWLGRSPATSVVVGLTAASVIALLGLVIGHAVARRLPGSASLDALAVLAFVTPASVLGVGLIGVWNHAATQIVYGTVAILVVGCVARYSVVGIRTVAAVVAQSPVHLEEAAAAAGAGFLRRLTRIVLPVNARGVGFAWVLALVFCLRDMETAVLFYPPGRAPLTVRIFTLEANGPEAVVAALSVAHVAITAAALVLGAGLLRAGRHR